MKLISIQNTFEKIHWKTQLAIEEYQPIFQSGTNDLQFCGDSSIWYPLHFVEIQLCLKPQILGLDIRKGYYERKGSI